MKFKSLFFMLLCLSFIASCSHLKVGMTTEEMIAKAGKPVNQWTGAYDIECFKYSDRDFAVVRENRIISVLGYGSEFSEVSVGLPEACVTGVFGKPDQVVTKANAKLLIYSKKARENEGRDYFIQLVDGIIEAHGRMGEFDSKNIMNIDEQSLTTPLKSK